MGYERGGVVDRVVRRGNDWVPTEFPVACPKAITSIGALPEQVADRCIPIALERRPAGAGVAMLLFDEQDKLAQLRSELEGWAETMEGAYENAPPVLLRSLKQDRAIMLWSPILAVADALGADWRKRAELAASKLVTVDNRETWGAELLRDCRQLYQHRDDEDRIGLEDMAADLCALPDSVWTDRGPSGKPVTRQKLGTLLRPFLGRTRQARNRDGKPVRGYLVGELRRQWGLYVTEKSLGPSDE
jgi:hypothetical protein